MSNQADYEEHSGHKMTAEEAESLGMTTKSQTDNTEWINDILGVFAHKCDQTLKEKDVSGYLKATENAKQAIQAKLKQQDIKSRIDELTKMSIHKPVLDREDRLKQLRSLL